MDNVSDLDLHMYAGKWYEIAKLPNPWQGKCHHSTTDYYVDDEDIEKGKVPELDIVSTCYNHKDQIIKRFNGHAYVPDAENTGALRSKWEGIPEEGWMVVYDTDYEHAYYALEGDKDKKYLWILSRYPEMCENVLEQLIIRAMSLGFDVEPLEIVSGSIIDCPLSYSPGIREKLGDVTRFANVAGDYAILKPAEYGAQLLIPKYAPLVKKGLEGGRKINKELIDKLYGKREIN